MNSTNFRYIRKIGAAVALRYCGIPATALWDVESGRVVWEVKNDEESQNALIAYHERTLSGSLAVFANIHNATYLEMKEVASKYKQEAINGA